MGAAPHPEELTHWNPRMKPWIPAAAAAVLALAAALPARADVIYKYGSEVFNRVTNYTPPCGGGTCLNLVPGARVQGLITTADPLPANLPVTFPAQSLAKSWTFVNGTTTISSTDSGARVMEFRLQTDQAGTPVDAQITVGRWVDDLPAGHAVGDWLNVIRANVKYHGDAVNNTVLNARCTSVGAGDVCLTYQYLADSVSEATYRTGTLLMDGVPLVSVSSTTVAEGDAGTTAMVFNVTLSRAPDTAASLSWYTQPGTQNYRAEPPLDYTATGGTLTWAAGDGSSRTITVLVNGDTTPEPDETLQVLLHNLVGLGGAVTTGTGTITNDDGPVPPPSVSIGSATVAEGNAGVRNVDLAVTLSHSPSGPVSLRWQTDDGTATAASGDYVPASGTLTWERVSPLTQTITVQVRGDTLAEPDETFVVRLLNLVGMSGGDRTVGQITIQNDDGAPPPAAPSISISSASSPEGDGGSAGAELVSKAQGARTMVFTVHLSAVPTAPVSVNWGTQNGSATAPRDYVGGTGTLNWAAGDGTPKNITIPLIGNTTPGPDKTFRVLLSNPTGATLAADGAEATGTIVDDDTVVPPAGHPVPATSGAALAVLAWLAALLGARRLVRREGGQR